MRIVGIVIAALGFIGSSAPSIAAASKADCQALQRDMMVISLHMEDLKAEVADGTENAWIGTLDVAGKDAMTQVRDARLAVRKALEAYIEATQNAAVVVSSCAR